MNWKEILRKLERAKQWDVAIEFMQQIIRENPNDMDAYIATSFLLMNLLVEEDYDRNKRDYYATLIKDYFDESYEKFSDNPEYLYFTGKTAVMSEWYFDIEEEDYIAMMKKAASLDPQNPVYQWNYYDSLGRDNIEDKKVVAYAKKILDKNSLVKKILSSKGAIGEYLLSMMTDWAEKVITKYPYLYH